LGIFFDSQVAGSDQAPLFMVRTGTISAPGKNEVTKIAAI
jgi:hypothetical protein